MAGTQVGQPGPFLEPLVGPCPVSDSDSDSEDAAVGGTGPSAATQNYSQVIHSGHFMVSCPHSDSVPRRRHHRAEPELTDTRSIDPTLTRLFECMSLEYSGKLVSPKWKNFKGLRLLCWDKIRLNNVIWRAWYIQYVERRKNPVCGFITPLEGMEADEHRKPEAVVLEGNYWKRRIEVVMREYHKWRIYYKKRLRKSAREGGISSPKQDEDVWRPTEKWCNQLFCNVVPMLLGDEEEEHGSRQHFDMDTFLSDISDTLFTMTQMPSTHQALPEDVYVGNADMIQPDLAPLQPSLDDMDISEIFTSHRPPPSQTQPGYQDPSCFSPMAEPLFSSRGSLMGARGLPVSPEAPLLPGTLLQPSGASQLSLHSSFLGSELPLAPLPPEPPDVAPSSLSPQLRHKPTLQYDFPGKCLSLEPPAPHYVPPIPSPRAPLLSLEPPFSPTSAPRSKFPYSSSPDPLLATHPASPLSSPCFAPYVPGLGYATGMGPQEYSSPAVSQLLPPALLGNPRFTPAKGPPQGEGGGPKVKPSGTKARRLPGHPLSHLPEPNPCPSQLLTTAKQDLVLDTPCPIGAGLMPTTPFSEQQSTVPKVPATFLARMAQISPGLAPGSSPSQVLLHTVGTQLGPRQVPKAEQLSPTSACGSDWPKPSQASPGPTARQGTSISLHQPTSRPGRAGSTKLWARLFPVGLVAHGCPHCWEVPDGADLQLESRRITHISAEQKRRFNIKLGFTTLHSLVSTLSAQPSIKVSTQDQPCAWRDTAHHLETLHPCCDPQHRAPLLHPSLWCRRLEHAAGTQFSCARVVWAPFPSHPMASQVSKATTLQKTAEYICKLQQERAALQDEAQRLREQIEELNGSINLCQEQLPATGVPITRQRFDHMRRMFEEYVRSSTLQNWKFWIFSIIIRPLFESFNGMVSTASVESLTQTSLAWLDQHCSLPALRPTVLSSLRQLSISTSILNDPAHVPEQAARAVAALGRPGGAGTPSI
ncbi:carbohydrate-responsive element-binding protein isoform X3 [Serinus canaria]|uniref:carbohydrate-responsive element-binding protein isoform X3 n=1 Tax=Serinus canaria TaxID=9135 RepID=UPI0008DB679B|nr:carbohydrate-responsive element-binding protein isoform X3 [Serinus canaria]